MQPLCQSGSLRALQQELQPLQHSSILLGTEVFGTVCRQRRQWLCLHHRWAEWRKSICLHTAAVFWSPAS